jgi:hypothetical protein
MSALRSRIRVRDRGIPWIAASLERAELSTRDRRDFAPVRRGT